MPKCRSDGKTETPHSKTRDLEDDDRRKSIAALQCDHHSRTHLSTGHVGAAIGRGICRRANDLRREASDRSWSEVWRRFATRRVCVTAFSRIAHASVAAVRCCRGPAGRGLQPRQRFVSRQDEDDVVSGPRSGRPFARRNATARMRRRLSRKADLPGRHRDTRQHPLPPFHGWALRVLSADRNWQRSHGSGNCCG